MRYDLAHAFPGWTLDYIDGLPFDEVARLRGYLTGMTLALEELADVPTDR